MHATLCPAPARSTAAPTRAAVVVAALAAAALPAAAQPLPYQLDPGHTTVHFEVLHMGTSTVRGRFDTLDGSVRFDRAARAVDIGIRVDTASVSTGIAPFDKVLRSGQLLAVAEHPQAWFVARRATFDGDVPRQVHGEITLRGVNLPLTLTARRWKCGFNPLFGREVCGGDFDATLKRSDFGMTLALPLVADEVQLRVQVEAVAQPADAAAAASAPAR